MEKVQKISVNSVQHTPSSESFQVFPYECFLSILPFECYCCKLCPSNNPRRKIKFIKKHPVYVCQMKVVGDVANVLLLLAYCGNWDNTLYKELNLTEIVWAIFSPGRSTQHVSICMKYYLCSLKLPNPYWQDFEDIVTYLGLSWLIIMGSGFDDWV
jgi:hypothetical protein